MADNNNLINTGEQKSDDPAKLTGGDASGGGQADADKGILRDLQAERVKRQVAEEDTQAVRRQLDAANAKLIDRTEKPADELGEQADDEELLTRGELRRMQAAKDKAVGEAAKADQQQRRQEFDQQCLRSEQAAKDKFTAKECGEGLDYDTVATEGRKYLSKHDRAAIAEANDPAAELYRRCVFCSPVLQQRQATADRTKMLAKLDTGGPAKPKGTHMDDPDFDRLMEKSESELLGMIRQSEGG